MHSRLEPEAAQRQLHQRELHSLISAILALQALETRAPRDTAQDLVLPPTGTERGWEVT